MSSDLHDLPTPPPGKKAPTGSASPFRLILLYTRGLIHNQHLRRLTMFYTVIAAMLMAFVGDSFLGDWLQPREHFYRFAFYWLMCGWLTILTALLAAYDLLMLRLQHRIIRRELRARMLAEEQRLRDHEK